MSSLNFTEHDLHSITNTTDFWHSMLFKVFVSVPLSFISIFTLLGNSLVVIAVLSTKSLHTVTNSFIVSLAVADLLVPIFIEPLSIYMLIFNDWTFGPLICDLWIGTDVMLCTASILNLCCISLDRYFAITRPLAYTQLRSPKLARIMITLVWITSVLISCPPVFGWKDKNRDTNTCTLNLLLSYRIYSSMGSFFIPCIIMVFVYIRIFIVIHNREKYLRQNTAKSMTSNTEKKALKFQEDCDNTTVLLNPSSLKRSSEVNQRSFKDKVLFTQRSSQENNNSQADYKVGNGNNRSLSVSQKKTDDNSLNPPELTKKGNKTRNFSILSFGSSKRNKSLKSQEQLRMAKESRAAKILSIVVGAFVISWLPFFVLYVLEAILPGNLIGPELVNSITWLGYCNSAINPIIYSFLSNPFRKAFYRLTVDKFRKK